jgi:hypothetical protein
VPFVPAPNTLEARLRYNIGTQLIENTLYFQGSAGVTTTLANTLGTNLITWWNTNFKASTTNLMALDQVYLTDLTFQNSFTVSVTAGLPSVGTSAIEALPFNCALCISFRTNNRGRSGRGRNYVSGLTENDQAASVIAAGRVSAAVTAYTALIGAGTFTPGLQWCVVSRFNGGIPRAQALVQPITNVLAVDNVIDSQRRRLPGRGR